MEWGGGTVDNTDTEHSLSFVAQTIDRDHRTSLELSPDRPLRLPRGGFSLDFELKLRMEQYSYGYVVRVIFGKGEAKGIDLISYIPEKRFNIISNDGSRCRNIVMTDSSSFVSDKWLPVTLNFDDDSLEVAVNGIRTSSEFDIASFGDVRICFGICNHLNFSSSDVAPMEIRNVRISSAGGKVLYDWPLSLHEDDCSYDRIKHRKAVAHNGVWTVDTHSYWERLHSFIVKDVNPQIASDPDNGKWYVSSDSCIIVYDVPERNVHKIDVSGYPYGGVSSNMVYDGKNHRLLSYTVDNNLFRSFDFSANAWSGQYPHPIETRQHHNKIFDAETGELVLFGGYGRFLYDADLSSINTRRPEDGWKTVALDSAISPRYLAAMGRYDEDNVLILGGYGSDTGVQEEFSKNYYDLHMLNFRTGKVSKIWDMKETAEDSYVHGNTLVIDRNDNAIYALTYQNTRYNTNISLCRFDIFSDHPVKRVVSDTIPYNFYDIKSYCDMMLCEAGSRLSAIVVQNIDDGQTEISIWGLSFPPVVAAHPVLSREFGCEWMYYMAAAILMCIFCGYMIYRGNRRRHVRLQAPESTDMNDDLHVPVLHHVAPKTICPVKLLGGFRVSDKDGKDLTGEFTPTLRNLFLFLLLNSVHDGRGATSQLLEETFWYDMDKAKATNNRNVNLRKLRILLDKMQGISMQRNGMYYELLLSDDSMCDYVIVSNDLNAIKDSPEIDPQILRHALAYISAGKMLPNVEQEWADKFKSDFTTLVFETLMKASEDKKIRKDHGLLLDIADALLISDNLDEDAVILKCRVLFKMGRKGQSKQVYDKYCDDSYNILGSRPELSYHDIISEKIHY